MYKRKILYEVLLYTTTDECNLQRAPRPPTEDFTANRVYKVVQATAETVTFLQVATSAILGHEIGTACSSN